METLTRFKLIENICFVTPGGYGYLRGCFYYNFNMVDQFFAGVQSVETSILQAKRIYLLFATFLQLPPDDEILLVVLLLYESLIENIFFVTPGGFRYLRRCFYCNFRPAADRQPGAAGEDS